MGLIYYHATTIFITTNKLLLTIKSRNRHTGVENKCIDTKGVGGEDGLNWQTGNDYILLWASQVVTVVKNPPANAGDVSKRPGFGRSSGGGQDNPLQYSCLENPKDRGAWQTTVHSVTKSQTQRKQLSIREIANENLLNSTGVGGEEGTIYL